MNARITELTNTLAGHLVDQIKNEALGCAVGFVSELAESPDILQARSMKNSQECLNAFLPELEKNYPLPPDLDEPSGEVRELWTLSIARIVLAAFLLHHHQADALESAVADYSDAVSECFDALPHPSVLSGLTPDYTAELLMQEIASYNREGWPITGDETITFKFPTGSSFKKDSVRFFGEHADLSAEDVALQMSDSVEVFELSKKPGGFDPLFYVRNGVKYRFLFKHWDTITIAIKEAPELH
jgi:hypothetical protein